MAPQTIQVFALLEMRRLGLRDASQTMSPSPLSVPLLLLLVMMNLKILSQKHPGQNIAEEFEKTSTITQDEKIHLKIEKGELDHQPAKCTAKKKGCG